MALKLLNANEAADILGVSTWRLYQLAREHKVPAVRMGERGLRFSEKALEEWAARGGGPVEADEPRGTA